MTRLHMTTPAEDWLGCFPIGDGTIGAMVDGGDTVTRIGLNHEHVWSGDASRELEGTTPAHENHTALETARELLEAGDAAAAQATLMQIQSRWSQAFLPVGTLSVHRSRPGTQSAYRRELDLETAVHRTWRGAGSSKPERAMVSEPFSVLVHEIDDFAEVSFETDLRVLSSTRSGGELVVALGAPLDVAPPHETGHPEIVWPDDPATTIRAVVHARVVPSGRRSALFLTIATTFAGLGRPLLPLTTAEEVAAGRLDRAVAAGIDAVIEAGTASHARLFSRSSVRFDGPDGTARQSDVPLDRRLADAFGRADHPLETDPGLAALLFDFGRYLLVSSARPGTLPPTLQGIWNDQLRPPWSSNYTLNINTQMNHWSSHVTNLRETAEPLRAFVAALAGAGTSTARRLYDTPGWVAHHNSDIWLFSSPVGGGDGDPRWAHWPMASAWLTRSVWDAVAFGAGEEEAALVWPIARGAAEFLLAWQRETPTGWSTAPSTSPENTFVVDGAEVALDTGCAMDDQLVEDCLGILVELARLLDRSEDPVAVAASQRLASIDHTIPQTPDRTVREWAGDRVEADPHHRHVSHLYGLFPGAGRWDPAAKRAAVRTLERRGNESTGWSLAWKTALWARLGRADVVQELLALLFRDASADRGPEAGGLYPNLFAAHPPFQIDANLAFPAVVAECLVQSHDGIELLPALPRVLASGAAHGLVARPGIEIDLRWSDGGLIDAVFRSEHVRAVSIRYRGRVIERVVHDVTTVTERDFAA